VRIQILNGTSINVAGSLYNLTDVAPDEDSPGFFTRNASLPINRTTYEANKVYIVARSELGAPSPYLVMFVSLRALERPDPDESDPEKEALNSLLEEGSLYTSVPRIIIEALFTSQSLTFNERVVISSILVALFLHLIKIKTCPLSWQTDFTKESKRLTEILLEKRRLEEKNRA